MIRKVDPEDIPQCVAVIRESFQTIAEEFGFVHTGTQKFDFFPFTCGYLEKTF